MFLKFVCYTDCINSFLPVSNSVRGRQPFKRLSTYYFFRHKNFKVAWYNMAELFLLFDWFLLKTNRRTDA